MAVILFQYPDATSLLQALCGAFLLPHAFSKTTNLDRAADFFARAGLRPAKVLVASTIALEVVAAVSLICDIFPKLGAIVAVIILAGAGWATAKLHGLKWRWQQPGVEYMVFWGAACIFVAFGK